MAVDRWFSTELTQHLFETKNRLKQPFHFDLVAININRGRDHGISGYTTFREFCGLTPVKTWEELANFIDSETVDVYRSFYKAPQDLDLFLGAVSENKETGRLVGPTLSCLLGLQYQGLKFGDRFWYETDEDPADFTFGQLMEIRKTSLAKLLCRNMNDTPKIQPLAFLSAKSNG
jgi:peroxidase